MNPCSLAGPIVGLLLGWMLSAGVLAAAGATQGADSIESAVSVQNNPYFVALLQIGMQKDQVPRFKELIGQYAVDRQEAINDAIRGRDGNLESRVRRAKATLETRFLADMEKLLNADQYSRFAPFNEELDKMLLERESLAQNNNPQDIFPSQN